jgi:transposase-like protein
MGKKRQFTSEFKVKVVLELLREERTLGEIAAAYEINPNQLATWRREFLDRVSAVFDDPKAIKAQMKAANAAAAEKDRLLKTIGQLTMERDYLQAAQAKREDNRRLL